MLLQPLVENAIKHGISARERDGRVVIRARHAGAMLELSVEDNGPGMDTAVIEASLHRGIGLSNVRERLRSVYGEAARFDIASEPGSGTRVNVRIPFPKCAAWCAGTLRPRRRCIYWLSHGSIGERGRNPMDAIIVDDEKPARDELRYLLGQHRDVTVVGEAASGLEALALVPRTRPISCCSTSRCRG